MPSIILPSTAKTLVDLCSSDLSKASARSAGSTSEHGRRWARRPKRRQADAKLPPGLTLEAVSNRLV
jgi:hypothetical protein